MSALGGTQAVRLCGFRARVATVGLGALVVAAAGHVVDAARELRLHRMRERTGAAVARIDERIGAVRRGCTRLGGVDWLAHYGRRRARHRREWERRRIP